MAKEKKETKAESVVEEAKEVKVKKADFVERKMKAVNEMTSPAKARASAVRILSNRKVGK